MSEHYYVGGGDGCLGVIFVLLIFPFWLVWQLVKAIAYLVGIGRTQHS